MNNYFLSEAGKLSNGMSFVRNKKKVDEETFYGKLTEKLNQLTENDEEKTKELLADIKPHLENKKPVTVSDVCFEIKITKGN